MGDSTEGPFVSGSAMDSRKPQQDSFFVAPPKLNLPTGGGAIRSIGEKFSANPVTGTGTLNVPILVSPGRSGFGPQLSFSYDSGAGNGPLGFGWSHLLGSIARETDKGLPRYLDQQESDVFILSGSEDLVPVLAAEEIDKPPPRKVDSNTYEVRRYRPRVEGLHARIERWTNVSDTTDMFWRTISRDNVTTWYGKTPDSRILDPGDRSRIFSWLISQSHDDKGNVVVYVYQQEDSANLDNIGLTAASERNRSRLSQTYLKRIRYGNRVPYFPQLTETDPWPVPPGTNANDDASPHWLFEVVFDYDEGHLVPAGKDVDGQDLFTANTNATKAWSVRNDPFSTYRPTFEVRTYRLCHRALMFHYFADEDLGARCSRCLVASTDFEYSYEADPKSADNPIFSYLHAVRHSHYRRISDKYRRRSTPPLCFEYSKPRIDLTLHDIDPESLENLPTGLDGLTYQWVDLDGDGLSGILSAQAGAWFYKRNISPISPGARFAALEVLRTQPAPVARGTTGMQLLDLAGDGMLDLVDFDGPTPGYYRRTEKRSWETLRPFQSLPQLDWSSRNLKFIDLTGDGHADLLISEDLAFVWHASLAEAGFAAACRVQRMFDEEKGPAIVFADDTESIFLADFSGDGLTDIVRVRNGEVCYWPNLGYGRFGARVTMDNAPWFEAPDLFDGRRLRLADIDGSGVTDIIYLASDGIQLYFNQSGNGWSARTRLDRVPIVTQFDDVAVLDLLGNGTACLVWSSKQPGSTGRAMRYIDLMGGQKPHLMTQIVNNLGAKTTIEYTPSTQFYLADKAAGKPWVTRLPFVVHCVSRTTVHDTFRNCFFTSTYTYHEGFHDAVEREFRGFGRRDVIDAEDYGKSTAANRSSPFVTNQQELFQPPVKTVTWFHTGVFLDERRVLSHYAHEYFPVWFEAANPGALDPNDDFREHALPEPDFVQADLDPDEWREALRACKGMVLREEVYELDVQALARGAEQPVRLFSTAYHNCHIERLQRRGPNRHAVFQVTESEAITYHYELDLQTRDKPIAPDPRVTHTLNLKVDSFGRILQSIAIGYPRHGRLTDASLLPGTEALVATVQQQPHLSYTETVFTQAETVGGDDTYRLSQPWETRTFQLTGIDASQYLLIGELRRLRLSTEYPPAVAADRIIEVKEIPYQQVTDGSTQRRLVEHVRTLYFDDQLAGSLQPRQLGKLGLPYEHYKLALTDDLLDDVFTAGQLDAHTAKGALARGRLTDPAVSGYLSGAALANRFPGVTTTGQYWIRSGVAGFGSNPKDHFYLAQSYTDPFGNRTIINYVHDLLVQSSTDALSNRISVEAFDFRVLAPRRLRDVSGNFSEVRFDILGMPAALALLGRDDGSEGDSLSGITDDMIDLSLSERQAFFTQAYGHTAGPKWLGTATARHVYWFGETVDGAGNITWAHHPAAACAIRRERHVADIATSGAPSSDVQVAVQYTDGLGALFVTKAQAEPAPGAAALRWIDNGKTILNNKGKPVKQYEPHFSDHDHQFDLAEAQLETGVTSVLYYDAPGRLIRTDRPDGTFSRAEFSPWHVTSFDANDTVLASQWYKDRGAPDPSSTEPADPDARVAWLTAVHSGTPAETHLDSLGREVVAIAHNRVEAAAGPLFAGRHWSDEKYRTFTKLDAEGKPLWIGDARDNLVMQYIVPPKANDDRSDALPADRVPGYDIAGNLLFEHSMDGGDRWMLSDAAGKPMLAWDHNGSEADATVSEDRLYVTDYDALHRPTRQWLHLDDKPQVAVERFEYQDGVATDVNNLNSQLIRHYDPSGLSETVRRDFKGNLATVRRTLVANKSVSLTDWQTLANADGSAKLNNKPFTRVTGYDALNRMARLYNWHRDDGSRVAVYEPHYNQRGLLDSEKLTVQAIKAANGVKPGTGTPTEAIVTIRYNAKGQKELLTLGSNATTTYAYDASTFRLTNIRTARTVPAGDTCSSAFNDAAVIQDLRYTYDPVGNISQIFDAAQATKYGDNQRIDPVNRYEYDPLYRLTLATGRENRTAGPPPLKDGPWPTYDCPAPDPARLQNYSQTYTYDAVGNIRRMRHVAAAGPWTRDYAYAFDDPTQPASNRLWQTWMSDDRGTPVTYHHDTHGNMLNLANIDPRDYMRWDHRDMIAGIDLGGGGIASYQYDSGKQRSRKYVVNQNGKGGWERINLGGYELYRRTNGGGAVVEEIETLHLMEGDQRILLVDDVITPSDAAHPRPDGLAVKKQTLYRYQYGNHLGSVCLELDDTAQIISYEEFHPYGTSAYRAVKSGIEAPPKRYRYTGMERDEESGLGYHSARYFAGSLGRWTSCDPKGIAGGVHLYAFVRNCPTVFTDPTGTVEQMELIETIEIPTVAVRREFSHRGTMREYVSAEAHSWNLDPKDFVLGHSEATPHFSSPAGTPQIIRPQTATSNALQSVGERAAAQALREKNEALKASGMEGPEEFLRESRVDVSADKNMRPDVELPPEVREMAKNYDAAKADKVAAAYAARHDAMIENMSKPAASTATSEPALMPSEPPPPSSKSGASSLASEPPTANAASTKPVAEVNLSEAPVSAAVESEVNINPGGNAVKLAASVAPTALAMYGTWTYLKIQQHANEIKNKGPGSMTKTDYLFMEGAGWNFKGIDADTMKGKWEPSLMHKLEDGFWGLLNIPAILMRPKSSSPWGA